MIPVEKNQIYIVDIVGLSSEGMGVGKIDGYTIFVEGALPKEKIEIKIVKLLKKYGFGKLIKIINVSENRVEPQCNLSKRCGGCQLQHLEYKEQLNIKTQIVKDSLERLGGLKNVKVNDTMGMIEPWRYRNKAQFPIGIDSDKKLLMGFYTGRSHKIVDLDTCMIQDEVSENVLRIVRGFIKENNISIYNEGTGKGLLRHLVTRKAFNTGEVMICIVINGDKLPNEDLLVKLLTDSIPSVKSIIVNKNRKKTNVILGDKNTLVYGQAEIYDYIGKYKFKISPLSFYQVNPIQTEVLYKKALEYAFLTGDEVVIDAYCGIGTISMFLSEKAKKVYGVEIVEQAIENAIENAKINDVDNVEFILGESEKIIPSMWEKGIRADVVVVDPPRKGCETELLDAVAGMSPDRIVYVSCNSSTLARDLSYLCEKGYAVTEVQPVDMFGHTVHVETVCLIERE